MNVCMNYKLEYDRINISEGIDVNKRNTSKECDICQYWHFSGKGFTYEKFHHSSYFLNISFSLKYCAMLVDFILLP